MTTDDMRLELAPDPDLAREQAARCEALVLALADLLTGTSFGAGAFTAGLMVAVAKVLAANWQGSEDDLTCTYDELSEIARDRMLSVFRMNGHIDH